MKGEGILKNTIFHKLLSTLLAAKSFSEAENEKYQEKELEQEKRLNEVEKQLTEQSKTISRQSDQMEKQNQLLEQINGKLLNETINEDDTSYKGREKPKIW